MKGYYCKVDEDGTGKNDFLHVFAHEFCLEGSYYRAGDAVNYSIGQGDTIVTPLQLARAYAALSNGGTLYEPRIAKAVVSPDGKPCVKIKPKVQAKVDASAASLRYVDKALQGTPEGRHARLEVHRLPARQGAHPRQDRLRRGPRQAVDLLGRDVRRELRRRHDGHPGRHRLGHRRARRCARSGSRSTASTAMTVNPSERRDPRHHAAGRAADVHDGRLDPAARRRRDEGRADMTATNARPGLRCRGSTGC